MNTLSQKRSLHPLFLLPTAQEAAQISTSTLRTLSDGTSSRFRAPGHTLASSLRVVGDRVSNAGSRTTIGALVILTTSLGAVDALFRHHIANRLEKPTLAELTTDEIVHAVLDFVDLVYSSDL